MVPMRFCIVLYSSVRLYKVLYGSKEIIYCSKKFYMVPMRFDVVL